MSPSENFKPGTRVRYMGQPARIFPAGRGLMTLTGREVQTGEIGEVAWSAYTQYERVHVQFPGTSGSVAVKDLEVIADAD